MTLPLDAASPEEAPAVLIISTLAEYQTRFWLLVARELAAKGQRCVFVSFDDRSTEMLRAASLSVVSANEVAAPADRGALFARLGINRLAFWTSHERFAFGRSDDPVMLDKLARAACAAEAAITTAREFGEPVVVQEVGGFLSVIGIYFAALAAGIPNWFIEPSFFRGRLLFNRDTFAAASVPATAQARGDADFDAYIDATLEKGAIVIPLKDAHHYNSALRKIVNLGNARRLLKKLVDKHLFGKRQEFGFIGSHVATHVRMLVNSRRLRRSYRSVQSIEPFVYFPLHVPGDIALTLRSPEYLDQLALVDFLCRNLPDGYRLALKEHPAMIGMIDPGRLRALLKRYPQLALIDPGTNNYEVMRRAAAVVTVNSKSGAEAGLLGLPVLVLGDAIYREAPFATAIERLTELPPVLAGVLAGSRPKAEPSLTRNWFAAVWKRSVVGELYVGHAANIAAFSRALAALPGGAA